MKTIEERAKEKSRIYCRQYRHNANWLGDDFVYSTEEIELACKDIATEQKKIDIERACEFVERRGMNSYWLCEFLEGRIPIDYDGIK